MDVRMDGGPHHGKVYRVGSGAENLRVDGKKVPIYIDIRNDNGVAKWDEAI